MPRKEKSWFDRNWGWVVGCGCLIPILFIAALAGLGWWGLEKANSSFPTDEALALASEDAAVAEALGTPLEASRVGRRFNMTLNNAVRQVEVTIGVSGPNGDGEMKYHAIERSDGWEFQSLVVRDDSTSREIVVIEGDGSDDDERDDDDGSKGRDDRHGDGPSPLSLPPPEVEAEAAAEASATASEEAVPDGSN